MTLDPSCQLYYDACLHYKLKPVLCPELDGFILEFHGSNLFFRGGITPFNDCASASVSCNKFSVNKLLEQAGLPVPKSTALTKEEFEEGKLDLTGINFPVVTKPTWDSGCGKGVFCNIKNPQWLKQHLVEQFEEYPCISIEEFKKGLNSYRILVWNQKVIGLSTRMPAEVIGDGKHSIQELIDTMNIKREKVKEEHQIPLGPLAIMEETKIIFQELGIDESYVPKLDERIPLRYICNSTFGGSMYALPLENLHPINAKMACKAAKELNLNLVGFDIICKNIKEPFDQRHGYFLEANYNPDITIHENTPKGTPTPVSKIIIHSLLKGKAPFWRTGWFANALQRA